jgi:hypothetical protein
VERLYRSTIRRGCPQSAKSSNLGFYEPSRLAGFFTLWFSIPRPCAACGRYALRLPTTGGRQAPCSWLPRSSRAPSSFAAGLNPKSAQGAPRPALRQGEGESPGDCRRCARPLREFEVRRAGPGCLPSRLPVGRQCFAEVLSPGRKGAVWS